MKELLSKNFTLKMNEELNKNEHKGNWNNWVPNDIDLKLEINHHVLKLYKAIDLNDLELIKEYSADVANLCEKAFVVFGKGN